ncbi:hypothetical protein [uncultured Marinobacter sp.]|uniref:hypothetical protein n=1 Tax=uncultured Marinobacter sp. TaxID=187379 RepID=UPI00258E4F7E|nr:hypothetical protein [uncultured Marinobacter sp.]
MSKTPTERVRGHRARHHVRSIDVREDALEKLKAYQARWELPNLSVAIKHAVAFSRPE